MTEFEAIKLSRDLWEELYKNFPISKLQSNYWEQVKEFEGACPCCKYYGTCGYCPLNSCYDLGFTFWSDYIFKDGNPNLDNWESIRSIIQIGGNTNIRGDAALYMIPNNKDEDFLKAKQAAKNIFEKLDEKYKELKGKKNDRT
jgi:hypothetical protein